MNRSAIDYDWPSTSLPAPSDPAQLPADPRLSIVNATEPFGVFRKRLPDAHRPLRLPWGEFWSPVAFIVANLIILWSGWTTVWKLGVAILIGYVILVLNRLFNLNPRKPYLDWKAAQWLPVYLVGVGLIVYFSTFGPLTNPPIHLWWDILVVAVFSLIIYYWALAVALPSDQIQMLITEVVPDEELSLEPLT